MSDKLTILQILILFLALSATVTEFFFPYEHAALLLLDSSIILVEGIVLAAMLRMRSS